MTIQTPPPDAPSVPPTEPSRSDQPSIFISRADAFIAWFKELRASLASFVDWWPTFKGELDATINQVNTGTGIALRYYFDAATADAAPAPASLRLSNAQQNLSTAVRLAANDANGADTAATLEVFDYSTSVNKGLLKLQAQSDPARFIILSVTAVLAPSAAYANVIASVLGFSAASPFVPGEALLLSFTPSGDIAVGTVSSSDVQRQAYTTVTTAGTAVAYTIAPAPALTAYAPGASFWVKFHATNGANSTIQISGLPVPPSLVKLNYDGTYSTLAPGDVLAGQSSRVTLLSPAQALVEQLAPALPGSRNLVINGGMQVSQYGNKAFAAPGAFYGGCDRILTTIVATTANGTLLQTAIGQSPTGQGQSVTMTTTGATSFSWAQRMEGRHTKFANGKTVTFRATVLQNTGATVNFQLFLSKPNALDNFGATTGLANGALTAVPNGVATEIAPITFTLGGADATNGLAVGVQSAVLGAQAATTWFTYDWWFGVGSRPSAIAADTADFAQEFARCVPYYYEPPASASGFGITAAAALFSFQLPAPMRVPPSFIPKATNSVFSTTTSVAAAIAGNWSLSGTAGTRAITAQYARGAGAFTVGDGLLLNDLAGPSPFGLNSEL